MGLSFIEIVRDHELDDTLQKCLKTREQQTGQVETEPRKQFLRVVATPLGNGSLVHIQDLTELRRLETVRHDFISNISHELRTPIASLKVLAETLQEGAIDDKAVTQEFLHKINIETDRTVPRAAAAVLTRLLPVRMVDKSLSGCCAIFLAEVAPPHIRQITRPAVELLVGIPSVVYGLVGMVVLCPLIADLSGIGSGSSVLAAAIVLAIMVLPTITSISEDSIRAVPTQYKEGALALGATHWQTIYHVTLPAARRGIILAIILGTGRAIGETMAMVMVIGNSPIFPTNIFGPARTITGNIAVEIAAATGIHEGALFATGLVLFISVLSGLDSQLYHVA